MDNLRGRSPGSCTTRERLPRESFAHYCCNHSCLAGQLAIAADGSVLPCVFARQEVLGDVGPDGELESIVAAKQTQTVWRATKDKVLVCADCEYRYVCFDCRITTDRSDGAVPFLAAPNNRCAYNPYVGRWGQGRWRLEDGVPVYNELETGRDLKFGGENREEW